MASGNRTPTWKERENNRRRERRRRAIAAKIFAGLRTYGNYNLPKHCDNNEVLKALAAEAGWTVEPDGTTYRKGCKPAERVDAAAAGCSASPSPFSSYAPSPYASYNPSPVSSSCPSPTRSPAGDPNAGNALLPWLKRLSTSTATHHYMQGGGGAAAGSISAPVTPPLSSPTARSPRRLKIDTEAMQASAAAASTWAAGFYLPNASNPASPTFSLVAQNPFGPAPMVWTPAQSGACSPQMPDCGGGGEEFAFGSSSSGDAGPVKAWEGERIHEECGADELELTLGTTRRRV